MSGNRREELERLLRGQTSPALRQLHALAKSASTEVGRRGILQPAEEILSVWSVRLWNSLMRGKRIVGLADLVRSLRSLPPAHPVEQVSLQGDAKTGLIFFDSHTREAIGAVVSVQTEAEVRRSRTNFEVAAGISIPAPSAQPVTDWNRRVRPTKPKSAVAA